MFRGINQLNLDGKGRMAVPVRYRERLQASCEGHLVVTVDRDGCLLIYPMGEWEQIEKALMNRPNMDKQVRRLQRLLLGHATEVDMDGQGRILIPPPLREFASLEKAVVMVGQGNKFELWDEAVWNGQRKEWMDDDDDDGELSAALESLSL